MLKTILLTSLIVVLTHSLCLGTSAPKEADKLFIEHQYQPALDSYRKSIDSSAPVLFEGESRYRALFRIGECLSLLFRYEESVKHLLSFPVPKDPVWKARFLLLTAEAEREYLKQYGHSLPIEVEHGTKDITRRTEKEWHAEILEAYQQTLSLKEVMLNLELTRESYFVDIEKADLKLTPTLWDLALNRWTNYLLSEFPPLKDQKLEPQDFIVDHFGKSYADSDSPVFKAAALFELASEGTEPERLQARESAKINRLRIPFVYASHFAPFKDKNKAYLKAAEIFKEWSKEFRNASSKAEALTEAAERYSEIEKFSQAVESCKAVEKNWPETAGAQNCSSIRSRIEIPRLALSYYPAQSTQRHLIKIKTRNIPQVHFRIIRTQTEELKSLSARNQSSLKYLHHLEESTMKAFLDRKADHSGKADIKYPFPHAEHESSLSIPSLQTGLFVVIVSSDHHFDPGHSLLEGVLINQTDILLYGSAGPLTKNGERPLPGKSDSFHLYSINAQTGKPVQGAEIEAYLSQQWGSPSRVNALTDDSGMASIGVNLMGPVESYSMDALATHKGHHAYWDKTLFFNYSIPPKYNIFIETDRPIYRPGQEVRFKVTVLERSARGYNPYPGKKKLALTAHDPNLKMFFTTALSLNSMGSASSKFTVPQGLLLGRYSLKAVLTESPEPISATETYSVEEYKRPEFEIILKESQVAWKYGKKSSVNGEVKYYFGNGVEKAPLSYRVYRTVYIPWFCWWWGDPSSQPIEIASGNLETDDKGLFELSFIPEPEKGNETLPTRFRVIVEGTDAGGRTLTSEKNYRAGINALLFNVEFSSTFLQSDKKENISVSLLNLNEQRVQGEGHFTIRQLNPPPSILNADENNFDKSSQALPLEKIYESVPDGNLVQNGNFKSEANQSATIGVDRLPPGLYRLSLSTEDPWGEKNTQSFILISIAPDKKIQNLPLPPVTLPRHPSYLEGEIASILLGSSDLKGNILVELWVGGCLFSKKVLEGGVQVLSIPVDNSMKGGFTVRWFGAYNFRERSGTARIEVPWDEKKLTLTIDTPVSVKPAEKIHWKLGVTSNAGRPAAKLQRPKSLRHTLKLSVGSHKGDGVNGEATLRIFDRSLEYYYRQKPHWTLGLYSDNKVPYPMQSSFFTERGSRIYVDPGWLEKILGIVKNFYDASKAPQTAAFRIQKSRVHGMSPPMSLRVSRGAVERRKQLGDDMEMMAGSAGTLMEAEGQQSAPTNIGRPAAKLERPKSLHHTLKLNVSSIDESVTARSDFSETALFEPHLKVEKGIGKINFVFPERLTSYRMEASVVTPDVKTGNWVKEIAVRKDFMVRIELPRFLRESDESLIKALVHNDTDQTLEPSLSISILKDKLDALDDFKIKNKSHTGTVKPHSVSVFSWPIKFSGKLDTYKIRVKGRSGKFVDAEERELSVFPSKLRLMESKIAFLTETGKASLPLPQGIPFQNIERIYFQIEPELALTLLNSMPNLVSYPYECTEQIMESFVPLSIMSELFRKNPSLKKELKKIPKRQTITPQWEQNDPRRMQNLMETPWAAISEGQKSDYPVIHLLEPSEVNKHKTASLKKLQNQQLTDGAFPWFPGGKADPYLTLYVLESFSEAALYGVEIPEDMVKKAYHFLIREIPGHLKPDESHLSLVLYSTYVLSFYLEKYSWAKSFKPLAQAWLKYASEHSDAMTPLGLAYAAWSYHRLGDPAQGLNYLERALGGSREDKLTGTYWTPEKISWLWYNDSVEKHAFFIRTLKALKPSDPRLNGMVKWILFNRKMNEWKSPRATAGALYSLLGFLKDQKALDKPNTFQWNWGSKPFSTTVQANAWLDQPLRFPLEISASQHQRDIIVDKKGPGLAYVSLTTLFKMDDLKNMIAEDDAVVSLEERFFKRAHQGNGFELKPLIKNSTLSVGDQIEVHLRVQTKHQFEYVHIKAPRAAGFEPEERLSGWKWESLSWYEEVRDSLTNFFIQWLPHGEFVLKYRLRATTPGKYLFGPTQLQSMYAPEISSFTGTFPISVME